MSNVVLGGAYRMTGDLRVSHARTTWIGDAPFTASSWIRLDDLRFSDRALALSEVVLLATPP